MEWKKGVVGQYSDRGWVCGNWGIAKTYCENCTAMKNTWNVYHNGKAVDTHRNTLKEVKAIIEDIIKGE